jgi:hypothetical protein
MASTGAIPTPFKTAAVRVDQPGIRRRGRRHVARPIRSDRAPGDRRVADARRLRSARRRHNIDTAGIIGWEVGLIGRSGVAAVLATLVVAGCSLVSDPLVHIDGGITPRMTPDQVAATAIERIHAMEQTVGHAAKPPRILSMTATTAAGVARLEPNLGLGQPAAPGVQWLVRAEGTFTNIRTPPGAKPAVASSGYFVISDADGGVLGFGFP